MSRKFRMILSMVLGLISASALYGQRTLQSFSADIHYKANGEVYTGKVYSDGRTVRIESQGRLPGEKNVTLVHLDSGVAQTLIPQMESYSEYPYGAAEDAQYIPYLSNAKVLATPLGIENAEGQNCEKVSILAEYRNSRYSSIEWRSAKLGGFVVRSKDADGQWSAQYTNVRFGAQSASVFQIPAWYVRLPYSRDWTAVARQMKFAEETSDRIAIAKKAGLRVFEYGKISVRVENPSMAGIDVADPITGTSVVEPTIDFDSGSPALPAPTLRSPENGGVFQSATRKITLHWDTVPGAVTYYLQVVILPVDGKETAYRTMDRGIDYIQQSTKETTFAFDLDGPRPGRWRVRAVDTRGSLGRPSAWSAFEFTP